MCKNKAINLFIQAGTKPSQFPEKIWVQLDNQLTIGFKIW